MSREERPMDRADRLPPAPIGTVLLSTLVALVSTGCADVSEAPSGVTSIGSVPAVAAAEYTERRSRALETFPDGVLLVHARPTEKAMEQWGFVQDPTFLYYTGLAQLPGAILALDGPDGSAHLFLPPPPISFGMPVAGLVPEPGRETAERLGIDRSHPWADFAAWVDGRLAAGVRILYVDEARRPEATGMPPGMRPVAGDRTLWRSALDEAFPSANIESVKVAIMEQKAVKSEAEVRILERNARTTVESLRAVASRLAPGVRQRETEAAMVEACIEAGGEGPSFWPWTMSGPNAHVDRLVGAFFRYDQGDRRAEAGELVRVDIGCAGGLYGADVGRTLPVSGRFTEGQAEAWDLLIAGYRAGLQSIRDGAEVTVVREASVDAVRAAAATVTTAEGRAAADAILAGGSGVWHIHGVGIESGEDLPDVLRAGMVVAYEPGFSIGPDAYYLEDMILVTGDGHRVLSTGLPYTSEEVAEWMGGVRAGS